MRQVTKEEAERTEHLDDCAGYDDCECFDERHSHREVYEVQQERNRMRSALWHIMDAAAMDKADPLPDHMEYIEETARRALAT